MIIEWLEKELHEHIICTEEIYVASGLISKDGAQKLIVDLKENEVAKWEDVHIIVGIDMPTPAEALKTLKKLGDDFHADVKYYAKKENFFHPKVYLFRYSKKYVAYVGSANYTSAGLGKNIELTSKITNQNDCKKIHKWFCKISNVSRQITESMLNRYADLRKKKPQLENMDEFKKAEIVHISSEIMDLLKECRQNHDLYLKFCEERDNSIVKLKGCIDIKNNFRNFNVKEFCQEGALGWIIPISIPGLEREKESGKLTKLCSMLNNERMSLAERVDLAMNDSKYKVERAGINVVSKILTVLYPRKCFLWNTESIKLFNELGNALPRGLSIGKKYEYYCDYYSKIINNLDIKNFAVLDRMLYYLDKGE